MNVCKSKRAPFWFLATSALRLCRIWGVVGLRLTRAVSLRFSCRVGFVLTRCVSCINDLGYRLVGSGRLRRIAWCLPSNSLAADPMEQTRSD